MRICAGILRFSLPDSWKDQSSFMYRSADGSASLQIKIEDRGHGYVFRAAAERDFNLYATGVEGATSSPLEKCKLGEVEALRGDVTLPDSGDKTIPMRLYFAAPRDNLYMFAVANAGKMPWRELEKVLDEWAASVSFDPAPGQPLPSVPTVKPTPSP